MLLVKWEQCEITPLTRRTTCSPRSLHEGDMCSKRVTPADHCSLCTSTDIKTVTDMRESFCKIEIPSLCGREKGGGKEEEEEEVIQYTLDVAQCKTKLTVIQPDMKVDLQMRTD